MSAAPVATVVVPARNAATTIPDTLQALARQDVGQPYEVIVVDNGSEDDTAEIAARAPGPVTVIRQGRQRPGEARNRGAEAALGRWLAFTDADCVPTPAWLREGLAALEDADLVQGAVLPDPDAVVMPFDRTVWVDRETGLYETASLFCARRTFLEVGGFEDWIHAQIDRPFGEDVWFGWKARRAGARTSFAARALVHHAVFSRGPIAYVAERRRLVHFPRLAAKVPELRRAFFYRRWFMSPRTAAFDLALAGGVVAVAIGSPLPVLTAAPYGWMVLRKARNWGRHAPLVTVADLFADLVGALALVAGSLRSRSPLL